MTDKDNKKTIDWTDEQKAAIETYGNNILVSASAGAGKTTLLVERVVRRLADKKDPGDLDRYIIMTFTKAAADKLKNDIFSALRERIEDDPSNIHLRRQLVKVHTARIGTIDAISAAIVRENFEDVDIDPGFKTADEAEIKMMEGDVLDELIEEHFSDPDDEFLRLVDCYTDKHDTVIKDLVLQLYRYSESHPAPIAWLEQCVYIYSCAENGYSDYEAADEASDIMVQMEKIVDDEITDMEDMTEECMRIAEHPCGPTGIIPMLETLAERLEVLKQKDHKGRTEFIGEILSDWPSSKAGNPDLDEDIKNKAYDIRKAIKKRLKALQNSYLSQDKSDAYKEIADCKPAAAALVSLTIEFSKRLSEKKKEKKIAGFSDIALAALHILIKYTPQGDIERDPCGNILFTETADRLSELYDEIIVDEYQDTNMRQEYLIRALSAERFGRPNVFMVGDVKQSIYGFRMACPELFMEKFDRYRADKSAGELVILGDNFRSLPHILDFNNLVFKKTMKRRLGGIGYEADGHSFKLKKEYKGEPPENLETEVVAIRGNKDVTEGPEAYEVVTRIEKLVSSGYKYSDIAIIYRSDDNKVLENALAERGIPLIKTSKKGFFDSFEIKLALDLLAVIDNPIQDIPLAAVLRSPLFDIDANGLAEIRLSLPESSASLYDCLKACGEYEPFVKNLEEWGQMAKYMELEEFIEYILEESGLYTIVSAMPGGINRRANLDLLVSKAKSFSSGSYSGLFNFIRYIKLIKVDDMDFGKAQVESGNANAVEMMTIHGIKGLERKIIFLVNTGKQYNTKDLEGAILLDRDIGVGLEWRDTEKRIKKTTLLWDIIKTRKLDDMRAEELRILYVALTRAKEKLIITGANAYLDSFIRDWDDAADAGGVVYGYKLAANRCYLHLLGMALAGEKQRIFSMEIKDAVKTAEARVDEREDTAVKLNDIMSMISEDTDVSKIGEMLEYTYPFGKAAMIQAKISPSKLEKEVKKKTEPDENEFAHENLSHGIERGNAYHRFLELFDYSAPDDIEGQLERFVAGGMLSEDAASYIEPEKIRTFLESGIGKRMKFAAEEGRLYRERPFLSGTLTDINNEQTVTGIEPTSNEPDEEMLLVQGIIDAFFEEDGNIILVDYKTDRNVDDNILKERYGKQQDAYADALQRIYEMPVSEKILYSIELGREVRL